MSRAQATILTNICLIEDLENKRVVMQYRNYYFMFFIFYFIKILQL